jgi:ribonuclease HI
MQKNKPVLHIYTDGGSRNNPGPAAIGVVIYDDNKKIVSEISEFIGEATNNAAEYIALIFGAQEALKMKAGKVIFYSDSQLVVRQITGKYKVRDKNLKKFNSIARNILDAFKDRHFKEIPREDNKQADALANRALDVNTLI